ARGDDDRADRDRDKGDARCLCRCDAGDRRRVARRPGSVAHSPAHHPGRPTRRDDRRPQPGIALVKGRWLELEAEIAKTVGKVGELAPGSIAAFQVEGKSVALANVGGAFFAFDNVCTHRGCDLATGSLDGSVVTCPCHGSRFEVATGVVVAGPATVGLETYAV